MMNSAHAQEQMTQLTVYIDASNAYRSSEQQSRVLRGQQVHRTGAKQSQPLFPGGDPWANQQLALTPMHTQWVLEHSRVAAELSVLNPHWDGDALYQEAGKIMGAKLQPPLPRVLGDPGMKVRGYTRAMTRA